MHPCIIGTKAWKAPGSKERGAKLYASASRNSAIDIGNNQVILVAADGIWGKIMNVNPYWAGYCSVLVNVNDIAAMGGKPLAMVNIMSISNDEIYEELLKGIKDGCLKFGVPMVGGHLHPDGDCDSLGVAIVGIAQKDKLITSFSAEVGDKIIVAIDLDGKSHEMFSLNWDTTYDKDNKSIANYINFGKGFSYKIFDKYENLSNGYGKLLRLNSNYQKWAFNLM